MNILIVFIFVWFGLTAAISDRPSTIAVSVVVMIWCMLWLL